MNVGIAISRIDDYVTRRRHGGNRKVCELIAHMYLWYDYCLDECASRENKQPPCCDQCSGSVNVCDVFEQEECRMTISEVK